MSYPGSHQKGPLVSEQGFKIGTKASNTEVINSSGNLVKAGAVSATASIADGVVTHAKLAEEAGFTKPFTIYGSAAIAVGKPVYISGWSTAGGLEVSLSQADSELTAAQLVAVTASTAADLPLTVAPVATVAYNSTETVGTLLYLSATAAGVLVKVAPTAKTEIVQVVGAITVASSTAGFAKMYPGYTKVIQPST